jgi:hypothetical protein
VIAYSTNFPTTVDIKEHKAKLPDSPINKFITPKASINGLTYLYRLVLADDPQYLGLSSNLYCRGPFNRHFTNPFGDSENRRRFKYADEMFDVSDYEKAAEEFEKLFDESPRLPALALRAAEAREKAGDHSAAKNLIVKAISAGWTSATWLDGNEALSPLMKARPLSSLANRLSTAPIAMQEPVGFSSQVAWTLSGHPGASVDQGIPYMMSCMLGVVHPRGSNLQQVVDVLKRSVNGDQTNPDAAFWFTLTGDVRTKTRVVGTVDAMAWLKHLNRKNVTKLKATPNDSGPVVGLMLGTATMKLRNRNWEFVPGAIADNLTSHGGNYMAKGQTKMTELLHAGAAMTSGTVMEPYSVQAKFPLPMMYGYYASGVTAIEAFYLSVACPYQLLIAGDPLAQPYSQPPGDAMTMQEIKTEHDGTTIEIKRQASSKSKLRSPTGAIEIYIEGKLAQRMPPFEGLSLNLPKNLQGAIEFRTVLIGRDALQPRAFKIHNFLLGDQTEIPTATTDQQTSIVSVRCKGADSIDLMHHGEVIDTVEGQAGKITVDPQEWGGGPVRVRPVAKVGAKSIIGQALVIQLPVAVQKRTQADADRGERSVINR